MPHTVNHTQLWYKGLSAQNGSPTLDRNSERTLLPVPTEWQRIIACRSEGARIHWLVQSGSGEDIWFTWLPLGMEGRV